MSTLIYEAGEHNSAQGTRDAFGAFSDDLVAAGLPPIRVVSGDREPEVQVRIFVDRYRQQSSGGGRFGDVRYWDGSAWGYPGGTRWVRVSDAGTVAVPGTGNHEKRRSNDLGWPYNSDTPQHARARQIAQRHNITCDGIGFGEWWHWTFWGPLGTTASASAAAAVIAQTTLEGSMSNPIVNVIDRYGLPAENGTVFIGLDNGTFEPLQPPFANNIRGIASVVFLGGTDGGKDLIPTLSIDDFNAIKPLWAQMCKGRTDAKAVWSELIQAQDENGQPLFLGKDGKVTTTPTGAPLQFNAGGFIASTNALANDAKQG